MKMLIVDDSTAMRRAIKSLLPAGDETFECSDGSQAVGAYASHRPDWVLMDIEMKELDGLSAARLIKAEWPQARIIIVTSHDGPRYRAEAGHLGAEGFVLKDRLEEINEIVGRSGGNRRSSP